MRDPKFGGFYASASVGFGNGTFHDVDLNDPWLPVDIPLYDINTNDRIASEYASYNYQCSATVFGIEGVLWSLLNGDQTQALSGVDLTMHTSIKYLASIRGRLGSDVGSALFNGTAGVGFTKAGAELSIAGSVLC